MGDKNIDTFLHDRNLQQSTGTPHDASGIQTEPKSATTKQSRRRTEFGWPEFGLIILLCVGLFYIFKPFME